MLDLIDDPLPHCILFLYVVILVDETSFSTLEYLTSKAKGKPLVNCFDEKTSQ